MSAIRNILVSLQTLTGLIYFIFFEILRLYSEVQSTELWESKHFMYLDLLL